MSKPRFKLTSNGKLLPVKNTTAYEGSSTGRRTSGWFAPSTGPNKLLQYSLSTLRNRSRAGYRNNPWIAKGINSNVTNEIGTGIIPRSKYEDDQVRTSINDLWDISAKQFDVEGVLDFYGLQAQLVRARRTSGEVFLVKKPKRIGSIAVPMQLKVLEGDFVPVELSKTAPNGNTIEQGIEFNRDGERVAYHMYKSHPSDGQPDDYKLIRIPANMVIHHYLPTRPGQLRGEPDSVQALVKAYTFDSYDDAELVRKQTRAPFTGFLTRDAYDENDYLYDPFTGDYIGTDSDGVPQLSAQPGTILTGMPGEKLDLFKGDDTGQGYADFMRQQLLGIAAGMGIPYELLTGDWSSVNDRLVRAILNEYRREIEMCQDHLTTHQVCNGVWSWWMDSAVAAGSLRLSNYAGNRTAYQAVEWRPQAWPYVSPETDVNAKIKAIEADLTSLDAEVAKTGWDADEIQRQNVEAEKRKRDLRQAAGLSDVNDLNQPTQEV